MAPSNREHCLGIISSVPLTMTFFPASAFHIGLKLLKSTTLNSILPCVIRFLLNIYNGLRDATREGRNEV